MDLDHAMVTPGNNNWLSKFGFENDISVPDPNYSILVAVFSWSTLPVSPNGNSRRLRLSQASTRQRRFPSPLFKTICFCVWRNQAIAYHHPRSEKPRPNVNPFGDAKPREVLLQERGQDCRKIDLELEHCVVSRPEIEEEKELKQGIDNLRKKLEKQLSVKDNKESLQGSGGEQHSLQDILFQKERVGDIDS